MTDPKLWLQLNLNPQVQVVTKNIPNGTIYYRPDRDKWIAMMNGVQEAARATPEACAKFLLTKYKIDKPLILPKDVQTKLENVTIM